jgi:hypothetical protein
MGGGCPPSSLAQRRIGLPRSGQKLRAGFKRRLFGGRRGVGFGGFGGLGGLGGLDGAGGILRGGMVAGGNAVESFGIQWRIIGIMLGFRFG